MLGKHRVLAGMEANVSGRVHASILAILIAVVLQVGNAAEAQAASTTECGPKTLQASVPLPQVGRAYRITLVVEDDCTISRSVAELSAANVALTRPQATVPAAVTFDTSYEYHVNARVWDCCGIVMTQLVTDLYWTSSGSTISWWNYGGFTSHHRENYTCTPPGSGWYATGPRYTVQDSGGVGYSTVAVRDHAEFGYKGAFSDCIDGLYYNVLENWVYGASLGEGDCGFYGSFRQTAPGWHVVVDCYYPYRTIVDQRY